MFTLTVAPTASCGDPKPMRRDASWLTMMVIPRSAIARRAGSTTSSGSNGVNALSPGRAFDNVRPASSGTPSVSIKSGATL